MKTAVSILLFLVFLGGFKTMAAECPDAFYGTVNYTDIDDSGRRVSKSENYRFREWSGEEQFDRILVKKWKGFPEDGDVSVTIRLREAGKSDVRRRSDLQVVDREFHALDDLNARALLKNTSATTFVLAVENGREEICSRSYPIKTRTH